jgi:hypothetical protein
MFLEHILRLMFLKFFLTNFRGEFSEWNTSSFSKIIWCVPGKISLTARQTFSLTSDREKLKIASDQSSFYRLYFARVKSLCRKWKYCRRKIINKSSKIFSLFFWEIADEFTQFLLSHHHMRERVRIILKTHALLF